MGKVLIGFAPEDRFMVALGNTLVVIRQDGLVFGADVGGRDIQPVFQFTGARIGFAPQDRFMVALGNTLVVIRQDGLVFGADVVGRDIQPVFQFSGAKIGFAPEDRFMVALGNRLVVIRKDGLVFGADVVGRDIQPVFQFTGANIGFAPEDRFMVALGNRLVVIRKDGLVFGADVVGRDIQPVFQFTGARIGFAPEDRFMVAAGNILGSRINVHIKVLDEPTVSRAQMVRSMQSVYTRFGIHVVISSVEGLNLPLLHDVNVGTCRMGAATTASKISFLPTETMLGPTMCVFISSFQPLLHQMGALSSRQAVLERWLHRSPPLGRWRMSSATF